MKVPGVAMRRGVQGRGTARDEIISCGQALPTAIFEYKKHNSDCKIIIGLLEKYQSAIARIKLLN
ncbi:hypothetical protein [Janthinobacterium sp. P210006]|uniref:hypothetical protein n=1 Tax=Janthinobacterium sp. P210006 TaxID=3112939 RepID=UPI001265352D|nr:hypothetical protein [Janthinobacterium sp. P210006]